MNCRIPIALLLSLAAAGQILWADDASVNGPVLFNGHVRPILAENCFQCHGPDAGTREADLRLDLKEGLFGRVADGGHVVAIGDLAASTLYQKITAADETERMPPADFGKSLTPQQIETVRRWIEDGDEWQGHWAFILPQRLEPPAVKDEQWPCGAIDRFILARLEAEGLEPSAEADRLTLLRRLSFDLTGLPPTRAEVESYQTDNSPQAYETVVDRLLASEHFGERLAMYWLDLVRYGDSRGYHSDNDINISPYRDYVIQALNDNMPFDQFTREQLAGDLLPNPTTNQIVATGYNRLVKTTEEGGAQADEYIVKMAADRLRTTAGTWLGITLGCAECHDHKYDPFTTKDFYSFEAIFADMQEFGYYGGRGGEPEMKVPTAAQLDQIAKLDAQIAEIRTELKSAAEEQRAELEKQIARLEKEKRFVEREFVSTMITVSTEPRTIRILPRGNWLDKSGEVVSPATPAVFSQLDIGERRMTRLDLANWLIARDNPLTARVFVNRLWKLYFGNGLSKQLDDLGTQGEWPTHPELLDWLAVEFMESGWNVKHMVKLLVMSQTYRQASLASDQLQQVDPRNRLYARQSRWRLEAELIRDNALAVSGLLVRTIGGPSVKPYQPEGYWDHLNFPTRFWKNDSGPNQYRRGLYTHWQRTFVHPSLLAFDAPTREECTAERPVSNTPKAALTLLNDPTYVEAARVLAARVLTEGGEDNEQRLGWAWSEALSRTPSEVEAAVLAKLLAANLEYYRSNALDAEKIFSVGFAPRPEELDPVEVAAWTAVARAILNLNEFVTRN